MNGNLQGNRVSHPKAYWYTDSLKNTSKMVHLTNDAIQKRSEDYGKFENGNKVS
jgi:tubulin--tyrosine ligase